MSAWQAERTAESQAIQLRVAAASLRGTFLTDADAQIYLQLLHPAARQPAHDKQGSSG